MTEQQIFERYSEIEKKIHPIVTFLEDNKDDKRLKGLYKGIITMQSPLVYQPEILFLGINPGDGAYIASNKGNKNNIKTPLRMIGKNEESYKELNWYEEGNARGFYKDKWHAYKWYQRDKRVNNSFPKRMIDLLYETAALKYPEMYEANKYSNTEEPFWFQSFGQSIMYSNLYPIATTNISDLYKILRLLAKEKQLKGMWDTSKTPNNWNVRLFFLRIVAQLVNLVDPKIIVCLGQSAFNDFTFSTNRGQKIYRGEKNKFPVLGFSRKGNWEGLIPEIAKEIAITLKESEKRADFMG